MRTTSPHLTRLSGAEEGRPARRRNRTTAAPRLLKDVCRLALCAVLLAQGFILTPPASARALVAPSPRAAQEGPGEVVVEPTGISNGAIIDLEIQNNEHAFGRSAATSDPEGPNAPDMSVEETDPLAPGDTALVEAINFNENAGLTGFFQIPPDPAGAVGPTHMVNVVNSSIEFYTKSGVRTLRQSLRNFFLAAPAAVDPPQTGTFDPKVIYDQYLNRFVVLTMERVEASGPTPNQSRVYVAVSDDSDPNGTWFKTTLQTEETVDPDGAGPALPRQSWADFPGLAVDSEAVYFTTNMFAHNNQPGAGGNVGQRTWIIAKLPFYTGGAAVATRFNTTAVATNDPVFNTRVTTTMQPTQMYGDTPGGVGTFLVAYSGLATATTALVQVIRVDNPLTTPTFTTRILAWGAQNPNANGVFQGAPQAGTTRRIATNDPRVSQNGVWRNNQLYFAAPTAPSAGPDANQVTARYFRIDTTSFPGTAAVNDTGTVGGEDIAPGTYTFFPSVAVDLLGNLAIGFAASAPTIFPGSYYTGRLSTDPPGTVQPSRTLRAGQDYYVRAFSTSQTVTSRWGDYTGMWLDPLNETNFYVYNEHALPRGTVLASVGPHEDGRWGTAWGAFSLLSAPGVALEGQLIISEFTPRGPLGALDEFVEIFNNTDSPHTVTASDASGGYSVAAEDGILRCTIPNGTVIPARGHFLCAGAQYIYISDVFPDAFNVGPNNGDIGDSQGIALFTTADPANYNLVTRLDAFGYLSSVPLYREGNGFTYNVVANAPRAYVRTQYNTYEKDTDENSSDFISVNARLDVCCDTKSVLGMAGPQNLASPINRGAATPMSLFDPGAASSAPANRERSATVVPNGQFGTLRFRRRITNNTGAPVTRMRIRVVDMSTLQSPTVPEAGRPTTCLSPCADLRVLSSSDEAGVATTTGPQPTSGTTLELAAYQTIGGGYNSSLNVNQVTNISPVAPGGFINVNILLGVQQTGNARFFVTVEVLP